VTDAGRNFLLYEGTDQRYGARHLKRAIERHVVFPLANLLATGQVKAGDMLCIDFDARVGGLVFWKESESARSAASQRQPVSIQAAKATVAARRKQSFPPRREPLDSMNKSKKIDHAVYELKGAHSPAYCRMTKK